MGVQAAVLFESPGRLALEHVTIDAPGPREVVVRVASAGLCHSDMHYLEYPVPLDGPTILGHESAGIVEAVGPDVTYVRPGDHVISSPRGFCGSCEWCLTGHATLCAQVGLRRTVGQQPRLLLDDGRACAQGAGLAAFAEQMLVHENTLVKIDQDIPLDRAALLGCGVITGVGAVIRTAQVPPGANVAVVGCGGIGLNCVQGAVIAGADAIIAIDVDQSKLDLALRLGATHVVNPATQDVRERIDELLPGRGGVDFSFEALGRRETYDLAFSVLRPRGTATMIGLLEGTFEIRGRDLILERKVQGSMLGSVDFRRDIPYFLNLFRSGRLKLDELISRRIGLAEINDGFDALAAGGLARVMITFDL